MLNKIFLIFVLIALFLMVYLVFKPSLDIRGIHNGDKVEEVRVILGEPIFLKTDNDICDLKIITSSECEIFLSKGAKFIGYWKLGIDTWVIIGFSRENKVINKLLVDT